MFYIVSYDIPVTKRRTKIAKTLEDFGDRVQYSVFECLLDNDLLEKMIKRLEGIVKPEEDSVRIYSLCGQCVKGVRLLGKGEVTRDEEVYIL